MFGGLVTLLNIISTQTTTATPTMRKVKKFLFLMPLISVPIWMTFPAAFNLYWLASSMV